MRIAVSGSHSTGKSTLISAFLAQRPEYGHEPEAYETLADDIDLTSSEGPDLDGLAALLEYTAAALSRQLARVTGKKVRMRKPTSASEDSEPEVESAVAICAKNRMKARAEAAAKAKGTPPVEPPPSY